MKGRIFFCFSRPFSQRGWRKTPVVEPKLFPDLYLTTQRGPDFPPGGTQNKIEQQQWVAQSWLLPKPEKETEAGMVEPHLLGKPKVPPGFGWREFCDRAGSVWGGDRWWRMGMAGGAVGGGWGGPG